jgi:hypothetical protein
VSSRLVPDLGAPLIVMVEIVPPNPTRSQPPCGGARAAPGCSRRPSRGASPRTPLLSPPPAPSPGKASAAGRRRLLLASEIRYCGGGALPSASKTVMADDGGQWPLGRRWEGRQRMRYAPSRSPSTVMAGATAMGLI